MGKKERVRTSFDDFYGDIFQSRWSLISKALKNEPAYFPLQLEGPDRKGRTYYLDEASYRTALLLAPCVGEKVLDMCAAPGGKSLVLISSFPGIDLTANERSANRRTRLKRVLEQHLAPPTMARMKVTGYDARTWFRHEQGAYDRILLDVPCSSERHIINSPPHLTQWSPARTKHLSVQAFTMLASALEVVKPGGTILYSTCALSPLENDGVIEKLHKKRSGRFEIMPVHLPFGEETRYGWQVLPDISDSRGPMYASMIHRLS